MKTHFASNAILFKKTLEVKDVINFCYSSRQLFCKTNFLAHKHGLWQRKWLMLLLQWSHNVIEPIPRILVTIWCNCCHHYHVFYDGKQQCWSKWTNSSMWFTIWFIYVDVFDIWTSLISCLIFFNFFVVAYLLGILIMRFKIMKPFLDFESSF